ncbi:unnamed protein product [Auanema sp. JU1783]|nr:unnamed protein product [Auanema sp. JU1783]
MDGDDYVPQMSQMMDYGPIGGMAAGGVPQPQHVMQQPYPNMSGGLTSMNPSYEQQMMMAPPPSQPAPPPQKPPPKGKKKKQQQQQQQADPGMDPMQSMAAMSNNPMMRPSMQQMGGQYPQGQRGMYNQGVPLHQNVHFAPPPNPYRNPQYPPNQQPGYPPMPQQIGYPPQRGYPPSAGPPGYPYGQPPQGYPQQSGQQPYPMMRGPQYPPNQQMPPHQDQYWPTQQPQHQPQAQQPPSQQTNQQPQAPQQPQSSQTQGGPQSQSQQQNQSTQSQQQYYPNQHMHSAGTHNLSSGQVAPPHEQWVQQQQRHLYEIHGELNSLQGRLHQMYQQPPTPEIEQSVIQTQQRMQYIQSEYRRIEMLLNQSNMASHQTSQQSSQSQPPSVQNTQSSQVPSSQQANMSNLMPQQMQNQTQVPPHQMPPNSITPPGAHASMVNVQHHSNPVQVTQTGPQVQVNIKPETSGRTLISVYHQYDDKRQSPDDQKDSVPQEPIPRNPYANQESITSYSSSQQNKPHPSQSSHQVTENNYPSTNGLRHNENHSHSGYGVYTSQTSQSAGQIMDNKLNKTNTDNSYKHYDSGAVDTEKPFSNDLSQMGLKNDSMFIGQTNSTEVSCSSPLAQPSTASSPPDEPDATHESGPSSVYNNSKEDNVISPVIEHIDDVLSQKSLQLEDDDKRDEGLDSAPNSSMQISASIDSSENELNDSANADEPIDEKEQTEELDKFSDARSSLSEDKQCSPDNAYVCSPTPSCSKDNNHDEMINADDVRNSTPESPELEKAGATHVAATDVKEEADAVLEQVECDPIEEDGLEETKIKTESADDDSEYISSDEQKNEAVKEDPEVTQKDGSIIEEKEENEEANTKGETEDEAVSQDSQSKETSEDPSEETNPSASSSLKEDKEPASCETVESVESAPTTTLKKPPKRITQKKRKDYGDEDYDYKSKSNKKRGKKKEEDMVSSEEEIDEDSLLPPEAVDIDEAKNDQPAVEKFLQWKEAKDDNPEMFYVKWKAKAYIHCEWKTVKELEEMDKRMAQRLKKFKQKQFPIQSDDDELFNPDFTIVDRIVDVSRGEDGLEYCLVKWRSITYDGVTWEPLEEIEKEYSDKIQQWRSRQKIDKFKAKEKTRPSPDEWRKLPTDYVWKNGNALREYQFEGVDWLLYCYYTETNCILADEMGLGKTVQTITFLSQVYEYGIHGPFLVVVPLSTIQNWIREFEAWTDMNAIVYHGNAQSRELMQEYEIFFNKDNCGNSKMWKKNLVKIDALVTTFETIVSDVNFLKKINWRVCVIDEAHRLKNRNCKLLTDGLQNFKMEHRVLLTGTPLQNSIEELFSLLNFLQPEKFSSPEKFLHEFGTCQSEEQVQKLQEMLKPMMLRRLKEDVEKSLGPKQETIIEVQLSDIQKKYYRAILERNFSHLCKGTSAPSLMNVMMELRKVCNHPFLIQGAEENIMSEMKLLHPEWDEETQTQKSLVQTSGKLVLIEKLLPKLKKDGHKVLIFSQMVKVLDLLEEFLINMSYPYERIDGNIRGDMRQASIDRFSKKDSDRFVFLLCTRAGGLGINLTAADTVIIFDSDWNPQNDLQAQARCHRIGQTKTVKVYRLITANTYEREMFDRASLKLGLDKAVLQSTASLKENNGCGALSKKDVEELLKKGAYGNLMDEANEGSKFNEEDIETILQRRATTITLEPGQKGSLFSKATFNSTHNKGDDIDIDDPNFWTKWAEKAQIDIDKAAASNEAVDLIIQEPRKRTKRFEDNTFKAGDESDGSDEGGKGRKRALASKEGTTRKRRRGGDEDDDYVNYRPDELAFNKSEYFKVEKVLASWGWGRWAEMKKSGELEVTEMDIMHMSRTLLLHCVREYRGDERVRKSVWNLIVPSGAKHTKDLKNAYNEGWAVLPEYNPPNFALDATFQRHIHRHANKLLTKVDQLNHLQKEVIGVRSVDVMADKSAEDIELTSPTIPDPLCEGWDASCDKSLLIGIYKHGLDAVDAIKNDAALVFSEKQFATFPNAAEIAARFRRLMSVSQRNLLDPVYEKPKWTRREEQEFLRVLRTFGMKDNRSDINTIDWESFRAFAPILGAKSDEELQEYLYCVLAMCTKAQGGQVNGLDMKRAMSIEMLSSKKAQTLMTRLHLTRKIHAIVANGVEKHLTTLKLCATEAMPSGWSVDNDKDLLISCDEHGIENIANQVTTLPSYASVDKPTEQVLLRRLVEICATIESGKWNGLGKTESLEESDGESSKPSASSSRNRGRKRVADDSKMRAMIQQSMISSMNDQTIAAAMLQSMMLPSLLGSGANNNATQLVSQLFSSLSAPGGGNAQAQQAALATLMAFASATNIDEAMGSGNKKTSTSTSTPTTSKTSNLPSADLTSQMAASMAAAVSTSEAEATAARLGISVAELMIIASMPPDTRIPVRNTKTKEYITGDNAPRLKNISDWLLKNKDFKIDLNISESSKNRSSDVKPSSKSSTNATPKQSNVSSTAAAAAAAAIAAAAASGSASASASNSASASSSKPSTPTPAVGIASTSKTETVEAKKSDSSKSNSTSISASTPSSSSAKQSSAATAATLAGMTTGVTGVDGPVAVYNKSTGNLLPVNDWPQLSQLGKWLDSHPSANVHSSCVNPIVQAFAGAANADRMGGEQNVTPQTPTTSKPKEKTVSTAASTSTASSSAESKQLVQLQQEMQMQLMMQQAILQQSLLGGFGAYGGMPTSSGNKAEDALNPMLLASLMSNPLAMQLMMDPNAMAAASLASLAAATPTSSKKAKQPPTSQ